MTPLPGAVTDGLATGIALADPDDSTVFYENATFTGWFPAAAGSAGTLADRIPGVDLEKVKARLERGRPYSCDVEARLGARSVAVAVALRRELVDGRALIVAECHDVSKQKQAEYMLDSYAQMAERNARELQKEKDRVEKLLLNIMPRSVYEEMKDFGTVTPQRFESATVMMLDFVQSTDMTVSRDPSALIAELNDIFSTFDRIAEHFGCERIKTMGDAYVAVSGLPDPNPDHAANICRMALRIRRYLEKRNAQHSEKWSCRIGVATGPLIGSLVGVQKYVYDIFGPAANLAARLEARCDAMTILISEPTWVAARNDFVAADLGCHEIKGFGDSRLFRLDGEVPRHAQGDAARPAPPRPLQPTRRRSI